MDQEKGAWLLMRGQPVQLKSRHQVYSEYLQPQWDDPVGGGVRWVVVIHSSNRRREASQLRSLRMARAGQKGRDDGELLGQCVDLRKPMSSI